MTVVVFGFVYAAALVFLVACVARAVRYASAPMHLRWELYPVPHEAPERVKHGGSYFEETDWWTKPEERSRTAELKAMLVEIVWLKGLWEFNRKLWFRSFPFHFGLYLLIATGALVLFTAILGAFPVLMHYLYAATGGLGAALTIAGALGLLHRRLTDPELKPYTTPADVFNLLFFVVTLGVLLTWYAAERYPSVLALAQALIRFDTSLPLSPLLSAGLILAALLAAYIPLTHMSHFIAKYFTYHAVRWDDKAVARDPRLGRKLAECLTYRPTWSAPHVGADGKKSWAEIAAANPWAKK